MTVSAVYTDGRDRHRPYVVRIKSGDFVRIHRFGLESEAEAFANEQREGATHADA